MLKIENMRSPFNKNTYIYYHLFLRLSYLLDNMHINIQITNKWLLKLKPNKRFIGSLLQTIIKILYRVNDQNTYIADRILKTLALTI